MHAVGAYLFKYPVAVYSAMRKHLPNVCVLYTVFSLCFVLFLSTEESFTSGEKLEARRYMVNMHNQVNIGDAPSMVQAVFQDLPASYRFYMADNDAHYVLRSPIEFGASNWRLLVEFTGARDKYVANRQVQFVAMRTTDDSNWLPKCAPADKGATNSEAWKATREIWGYCGLCGT